MTTLYEKLDQYIGDTFLWPDDDIYHYTKTGNKIINSGFFRLKSHHDLNKKGDNGELIVGPSLTRKYLKKLNLASHIFRFNKFIDSGITLHIGSFSEQKNNQHAIEKYGSDCLKFSATYLRKLPERYHALIGSVVYDAKKQDEIISTMLDLYEKHTDEEPTDKYRTLLMSLCTVFPLLKEERHHPDAECRIVTVCGHEEDNPTKIIGQKRDRITFGRNDVILL